MQIIRTIVWVLVLVALLVFAINNWTPISVKIWEGLLLETKIPALVIVAFLIGLVPMWVVHRGAKWRLERRIATLENAIRSACVAAAAATPAKAEAEAPAAEDTPPAALPPANEAQ
jgi:hypothetical protein